MILLGTPAEEVDGGKINLINAGAYKPMDVCLMLHPAPMAGVAPSLAIAECVVNYEGHTYVFFFSFLSSVSSLLCWLLFLKRLYTDT